MIFRIAICSLVLSAHSIYFPTFAFAEVDQSPLEVRIVPAFPDLEWPDWMLGVDDGKPRDPRPVALGGAGDGTNRIFVVSEHGTIHVWPNDPAVKEMETFLDIRDRVQYDD